MVYLLFVGDDANRFGQDVGMGKRKANERGVEWVEGRRRLYSMWRGKRMDGVGSREKWVRERGKQNRGRGRVEEKGVCMGIE